MTTPVKSTGVLQSSAEADIFTFYISHLKRGYNCGLAMHETSSDYIPLGCVLAYDKHLLICNSIKIFFSGLALLISWFLFK